MRLSIIILLAATLLGSCQTGKNDSSKIVKLNQNDAEYTLLKKGNGKASATGDFILFSLTLKGNNGKILVERLEESTWAKEQVKDVDSTTIPILEMLYSLSEGDSVMMYKAMDGDQRPQGMEDVDTLIYFINI